jgi:GNAT superfamily N-acetyltransferase
MAASSTLLVRPVAPGDRVGWEPLWLGYLDFYKTALAAATTDATWARINGDDASMGAFVAELDGRLIGFVHYVLHPTTWTVAPACYLEDLFVASEQRGTGAGRALIEHLTTIGRDKGWSGIHWMTAHDNEVAMRLYDRIATRTQWVRYEIDLA